MAIDAKENRCGSEIGSEADSLAPAILNELAVGVLHVDARGNVLYRNRRAALWSGDGDRLEVVFRDARFSPAFEGWDQLLHRVTQAGEDVSIDCALDGPSTDRPSLLTLHCRPLPDPSRRADVGVVIALQPCAGTQEVEPRLEVAQRLLSLGKLAAQVAHELNNPLDGILRYINLALRLARDAPEPKLRSYLSESRTGLLRMVRIIGDLLEYSRTSSGEVDAMSINEVVEQAVRNARAARGASKVLIALDFQEEHMPIVGGSRLHQVCCNLINNALDAMPDGGRLTITTGLVGDDVVIRFADTGGGLPADADTLFQPFFTTKAPGKGTGLGLAICREFVEAMQGTMTASDGDTEGAVFTVRIPASSCRRPLRLADRSAPHELSTGVSD